MPFISALRYADWMATGSISTPTALSAPNKSEARAALQCTKYIGRLSVIVFFVVVVVVVVVVEISFTHPGNTEGGQRHAWAHAPRMPDPLP